MLKLTIEEAREIVAKVKSLSVALALYFKLFLANLEAKEAKRNTSLIATDKENLLPVLKLAEAYPSALALIEAEDQASKAKRKLEASTALEVNALLAKGKQVEALALIKKYSAELKLDFTLHNFTFAWKGGSGSATENNKVFGESTSNAVRPRFVFATVAKHEALRGTIQRSAYNVLQDNLKRYTNGDTASSFSGPAKLHNYGILTIPVIPQGEVEYGKQVEDPIDFVEKYFDSSKALSSLPERFGSLRLTKENMLKVLKGEVKLPKVEVAKRK